MNTSGISLDKLPRKYQEQAASQLHDGWYSVPVEAKEYRFSGPAFSGVAAARKSQGNEVKCLNCEAVFNAPKYQQRKYCSLKCAYASPDRAKNCIGKWQEWEDGILKTYYENTPEEYFSLEKLAGLLHRTFASVALRASRLKITGPRTTTSLISRERLSASLKEGHASGRIVAKYYGFPNGHPRGMLGKKHTPEVCAGISARNKGRKVPPEQTARAMKTKLARYGTIAPPRLKTTWKAGWREIGGIRIFARSRWEANYARYLQFLKENGQISNWEHEPETFWFEGIKRGVRSYLPDFRVTDNAGAIEYHEVKGWMDDRSVTKLKRMKKYHPSVTIKLIQSDSIKALNGQLGKIIKEWES